jgi:phosphotransferase system HPr (HPr) family protein
VISADDGMHARPVADLARLALAHPDPVSLTTASGATVDVGSVLAVMDLALGPGDAVRLETVSSQAADDVLDAMAAILAPR